LRFKNASEALERLDDDEKGIAISDTLGGKQELLTVSESGLYTIVLHCRDAAEIRLRAELGKDIRIRFA